MLPAFHNTTSTAKVLTQRQYLSKVFYRIGTENRCGDHDTKGKEMHRLFIMSSKFNTRPKKKGMKAVFKQAQKALKNTNSDT